MSESGYDSQPEVRSGSVRGTVIEHLISRLLPTTLLDERLAMGFYALNGFRYLALPAWVEENDRVAKTQQFTSLIRLDRNRVLKESIKTISVCLSEVEAILPIVRRLDEPRHRFISELFWLHLSQSEFNVVRHEKAIIAPAVFKKLTDSSSSGNNRSQRSHALALISHCVAIDKELNYLESASNSPVELWLTAHTLWLDVCADEKFWTYMESRAAKLDDPRLKKEDVARARVELPLVILGIHEVLADFYFSIENYSDCLRHLHLIRNSGFDGAAVSAATWSAVKKVTETRLDELLRKTKLTFSDIKIPVSKEKFEEISAPLIQEARDIHRLLSQKLEVPSEFFEQSAFDSIIDSIHEGMVKKIEYDNESRERSLLYSSLLDKKLLSFPLSSQLRTKIEASIRSDRRMLYSAFSPNNTDFPDPTMCFFVEGAESDPDESLVIPMIRITKRTVNVNHAAQSYSLNVAYASSRLLIPRSILAASAKSKKIQMPIPKENYTPEQKLVATKLFALEEKLDAKITGLDMERNRAISAENKRCEEEVAMLRAREQKKLTEAETEINKENQNQKTEITAIQKDANAECKNVKIKYKPLIEAATKKKNEFEERWTGTNGIYKIILPTIIFIALFTWFGWGNINKVFASVLFGYTFGALARYLLKKCVSIQLNRENNAYQNAVAKINKESETKIDEIKQKLAERRKPWEAVMAAIAKQQDVICHASLDNVKALRTEYESKKNILIDEFEQTSKQFNDQLKHECEAKPLSRQEDFPIYHRALSNGYKKGKEPSSQDMQMTAEENSIGLWRLRTGN